MIFEIQSIFCLLLVLVSFLLPSYRRILVLVIEFNNHFILIHTHCSKGNVSSHIWFHAVY